MNINFQNVTNMDDRHNISEGTDAEKVFGKQSGRAVTKNQGSDIYVTLGASANSINAYASHSQSVADIQDMAGSIDAQTSKNYQALLSNTMSPEDYGKAMEDGFDPKSMDDHTTVTIMDKIKTELAKAGKDVKGFTDDIDIETLTTITGSRAFANSIKDEFTSQDISLTIENVKDVVSAYSQIEDITGLNNGAKKYLIENDSTLSAENIYMALHSTNGKEIASNGFYAQEAGGYYARKAGDVDWNQLKGQALEVIKRAGYDENDESAQNLSKWMIEEGIPLTKEHLQKGMDLENIAFPVSMNDFTKAAASAIADGGKASGADLSDGRNVYEKARDLFERVASITDGQVNDCLAKGQELNIRNLAAANDVSNIDVSDLKGLEARKQLEEVRLKMSVQANITLMRSGIEIDTRPLMNLVNDLQAVIDRSSVMSEYEPALDLSVNGDQMVNHTNTSGYAYVMSRLHVIGSSPLEVVGQTLDLQDEQTLGQIADRSEKLQKSYQQAGKAYETVMTSPRADLGDTIKKAFQNIDDILVEKGLDPTDDSRRAVRILAYNKMDVTKEAIENVEVWDGKLKGAIKELNPAAVLELIRDGQNPLDMTIDQLKQNLSKHQDQNEKSDEKYSKFLYKMEKNGKISEEERKSFIGIYRLFNTLKVTDYAAIGSLLNTGAKMTLGNLLTATRTNTTAKSGIDVTADAEFAGITTATNGIKNSISEQISAAFSYYSQKADTVYENLEPEKLHNYGPDQETLLTDLADAMEDTYPDQEADHDYYQSQIQQMHYAMSTESAKSAVQELRSEEIQISFNNIEGMIGARRARRHSENVWNRPEAEDDVEKIVDELGEEDFANSYKKHLASISDKLSDTLGQSDTYIDVRAIAIMNKQISVHMKAADNSSFDVPVEIDGSKVSMHVTLQKDDTEGSSVKVSVQTFAYGMVAATMYENDGSIFANITTDHRQQDDENEYWVKLKDQLAESLNRQLPDLKTSKDNISFIHNARVLADIDYVPEKDESKTSDLLKMAKAFVEAIR